MGFYSFYRIFKDIIRTIFGNKAFKFFLIFVIICFVILFANKSFASTTITGYNLSIRLLSSGHVLPSFNDYDTTNQQLYNAFVFPVFEGNSYTFTPSKACNYGFISDLTPFMISGETYRASDDLIDALVTIPIFKIGTSGSVTYYANSDGYVVVGGYTSGTFTCSCTSTGDGDSNLSKIQEDVHQIYNYLSIIRSNWNYLLDGIGNIQSYQQELIDTIQGTTVDKSISYSTISGLSVSNGGGNGSFQSGSSSIIYFELDPDKVNYFDFSITSRFEGFSHVYGYCNSIPSASVSYNYLGSCVNGTSFNNVTTSVPKGNKYFFVRLNGSNSTFTLNKYSVGYGGLDEVNQEVINQGNQTRDTLTDSSISQDTADYSLPTDSTNDITNDGFTSIFDRIRSTFTTGSSTPATINVPFTNKSFTISKSSVFGSANLGIVQTIIEAFWWFVVSLFIVKDIFKKIEKIKTGNIEFTETTNIKEDIL